MDSADRRSLVTGPGLPVERCCSKLAKFHVVGLPLSWPCGENGCARRLKLTGSGKPGEPRVRPALSCAIGKTSSTWFVSEGSSLPVCTEVWSHESKTRYSPRAFA